MSSAGEAETMRAVRIHEPGGAEALRYEAVPIPRPGAGEALVRVEAAGVNFIDVYKRTGLYKVPLPSTLGEEGAGTVTAVGEGVTDVRVGDRVAWAGAMGSYAEHAAVPATKLVPLPAEVSAAQGAALMLQGITAHYLAVSTCPLRDPPRWTVTSPVHVLHPAPTNGRWFWSSARLHLTQLRSQLRV